MGDIMKKLISILLSVVIMLSLTISVSAINYEQPFDKGTLDCELYRIPAIYTLTDGTVVAAADMRYNHGSDSPNNLDTLVATSKDGYTNWEYNVINRFDDYAESETDAGSASFIDSALGQSNETGRVFIVTDAYPSDGGVLNSEKGTGYTTVGTKSFLSLKKKSEDNFNYYVSDFTSGFADIVELSTNEKTEYTVDSEYKIYKNGEPVTMKQVGSEKNIQQSVFYKDSDFTVLCTTYLWLRYSDDNCKTWSKPVILNPMIKGDDGFLGVAPGRMTTVEVDGHERIIFMVYTHSKSGKESVCTIYSDDNGITWNRGETVKHTLAVGKTSESQIVKLNDGILRMFCRNKGDFVAYCDSTDGGITWSKAHAEKELPARGNCMLSFINTSKTVDGKKVILGSFASNQFERADGVVKVGLLGNDNSIEWVNTYHVTDSFFAYSCLTELSDGSFGYLYEDEPAHISYAVLELNDKGELSEINGNNIDFKKESEKGIKVFLKNAKAKLQQFFRVF